jgi:hypothetical protein
LKFKNAIILAIFSIFISGCSSIVKPEQSGVVETVLLTNDSSIGQTFVAHYDGLNGFEIYFEPNQPGNGNIELHLLKDTWEKESLAIGSIPIREITAAGFYPIEFSPQSVSFQKDYYLLLQIAGAGQVLVGSGTGESYLNGAIYRNNEPGDAQLSFNIIYSPGLLTFGLLKEGFTWLMYLLVAAFLFVIPGWAILSYIYPVWQRYDWASQLALSVGVSLAFYPLLLLWTNLIDFQLGPFYAWLPPVFGLLSIFWRKKHNRSAVSLKRISEAGSLWIDFTLIIILGMIFAMRFWVIRSLDAPMWGDSVQHTIITQLILDNGGLFDSWEPYAPYNTLTTHFGFSVFAALFAWVTKLNSVLATMLTGQIINGLAILAIYPLSIKMSRNNRWAGIGTLLAGGLLSIIPAVYVNWGRYAQLSGQVILPISIYFTWIALEKNDSFFLFDIIKDNWKLYILAGIGISGMTLSYYRMPYFFVTFILCLMLLYGVHKWQFQFNQWKNRIVILSFVAAISLLLFLPWGVQLFGSKLALGMENSLTIGVSSSTKHPNIDLLYSVINYLKILFSNIYQYSPAYLLIGSGLSWVIAVNKRRWAVVIMPLWVIILLAYSIGRKFNLPGSHYIKDFTIYIALYIPISVIMGNLVVTITELKHRNKFWLPSLCILIITVAILEGGKQRLIVDQFSYNMVTRPDIRASEWIKNNTFENALFLAQGFEYRGTVAGSDAGWWLPLLAGRSNSVPPQYAQFNETSHPKDFTKQVVDLVDVLETHSIVEEKSIQALCKMGITHTYHGQRQGKVGQSIQLFSTMDLDRIPTFFTKIYHRDRVQIYEFDLEKCTSVP